MTWDQYQVAIRRFDQSPRTIEYYALGLCGEAGEVAEKVKKELRTPPIYVGHEQMKDELGDVLWYLTAMASAFNISLEEIARRNIEKLEGRLGRGVLQGNGDDR